MTDADPFAHPEKWEPADADDLIRNGRYYVPDPDGGPKMKYFTRVTNFAKHISDTYRLSLWQQRMAIAGICMDDGLRAEASNYDVTEDRKDFDKLVEKAKERADRKGRARLGSAVHKFTERLDEGSMTVDEVPSTWRPDVQAYADEMERLGLKIARHDGRLMSEGTVYEPHYGLMGTLDRVVEVTKPLTVKLVGKGWVTLQPGDFVIFDLKTGARALEFGGHEHAIQFASYANSTRIFHKDTRTYTDMMPGIRTDIGLVLHLPVGEARAEVAGVDIEEGWRAAWLVRQVKDWQNNSKLLAPVVLAGE